MTVMLNNAAPFPPPAPARCRGRPREFNLDDALDKAIAVFCERGYHATSIADLAAAMELASGSIYKAFKDKRAVFMAALDRARAVRHGLVQETVQGTGSGREKIRALLLLYAESSHGVEGQRGCMIVGSAVELATFDTDIAAQVRQAVRRNESVLEKLLVLGQADGSVPATVQRAATARMLLCLIQGMCIVGKTGPSRADMTALVDVAMKTLECA